MMRCPVCRADNDCGPTCRRCRADLALLFTLEEKRERVMAQAAACLRRGRLARAQTLAGGADALRSDPASRRMLAVCHLLRRDYPSAFREWPGASSRAG